MLLALAIPCFPLLAIFLGVLEYFLVFFFHFLTMRFNIFHNVGHLFVGEVELSTDQMRRPSILEVIHDAV